MKQFCAILAALLGLAASGVAHGALAVGDAAPGFSGPAVTGEGVTRIDLAALLGKGPVVIFFLPSVFVGDSAAECRDFAAAIDAFHAAGASVIGMSRDSTEALARFSSAECGGKVPLASADMAAVTGFDVNDSANFTTRTTYVIAPGGGIVFVDGDDDYGGHARAALAFVQRMKR